MAGEGCEKAWRRCRRCVAAGQMWGRQSFVIESEASAKHQRRKSEGRARLFYGEAGLLGRADGEAGGAHFVGVGVVDRVEDDLIVAGHEDDALGGVGWVEVADPLQAVALEDEDAPGSGDAGFVERQLSGHGYLQVGRSAAAQFDIGEAGDGLGEDFDVVLSGKVVAGGTDGLCGEECRVAVAAHEHGVDGQLEGDAAAFVVQCEGALRGGYL